MWQFNHAISVSKHPAASQHSFMSGLKVSVFCSQFLSKFYSVIALERHLRDTPNRAHCAGSMSRILRLIEGPKYIIPNHASTSYYSWFSSLFAGPAKCHSNYGKLYCNFWYRGYCARFVLHPSRPDLRAGMYGVPAACAFAKRYHASRMSSR